MSTSLAIDACPSSVEPVLACVGLGANLGHALSTLKAAVSALAELPGCELQACSSFYRSAPIEALGPDFINGVALVRTRQHPLDFLRCLQALESLHQRERPYRNAPRTLDLDLLLWGHEVLQWPELQVPHPRLHQRAFALLPLAEVLPNLEIPQRGSIRDLLSAVSDQSIEILDEAV
jgi:2-amino-4-hydroxy-6-hydroxymethyldihydropteridine diphosphokinase